MSLTFNGKYLLLAVILFFVEVLIALFVRDSLIRPFVGDAPVVMLIYCFVRTLIYANYFPAALGVLVFACLIEVLQHFDHVRLLGLEQNRSLSAALGRTFEWLDVAAYFAGFSAVIMLERLYERYATD